MSPSESFLPFPFLFPLPFCPYHFDRILWSGVCTNLFVHNLKGLYFLEYTGVSGRVFWGQSADFSAVWALPSVHPLFIILPTQWIPSRYHILTSKSSQKGFPSEGYQFSAHSTCSTKMLWLVSYWCLNWFLRGHLLPHLYFLRSLWSSPGTKVVKAQARVATDGNSFQPQRWTLSLPHLQIHLRMLATHLVGYVFQQLKGILFFFFFPFFNPKSCLVL